MRVLVLRNGARKHFGGLMVYQRNYVILVIFFFGLMAAESFVEPKKTSTQKMSADDCCQQILWGGKEFARISQYTGAIQAIDLLWVEDYFDDEKNGVFNLAAKDQAKLQDYVAHKEKYNRAREEYEKVLKEELEFLKQFESSVRTSKKKK